jgi:hypothetical protein
MNNTQSNVTPITDKQPAPAARFTVMAQLDGFPVSIEVEGNANNLRALVDRLKAIGAEPPAKASNKAANAVSAPEDAPICEFHGKMKRSIHGGWFCPKKMGDGSYCKSKA